MSLLLKSELRLRLGPRRCEARLLGPGWRAREVAALTVETTQGEPLLRALDALESQGLALPARARIVAEDEFLYFTNLPGGMRAARARDAAAAHFAQALGIGGHATQVSLNAAGDGWLAVALPSDLLAQWRDLLTERGIALAGVGAAALDDLYAMRRHLPASPGLMGLVRDEGVVFAELQAAGVARLHWERCDTDQGDALAQRIRAALAGLAPAAGDGSSAERPAVTIVPLRPDQQPVCEALCNDSLEGWTMRPAISAAPVVAVKERGDESPSAR